MSLFLRNFTIFILGLTVILLMISDGSDAERTKRYIGGRDAQPGENNWVVSIGFRDQRIDHVCGGSIIDERYILTAAHCLELIFPDELIVRSGIIDITDTNAILTGVSRIIRHPGYSQPKKDRYTPNDIALLKLDQNLELGGRMSAIALPTGEPQEGNASFAGWGSLHVEPVTASRILQIATMKVISDEECERKGRTGRRPVYFCAYDARGMTFTGDSGSPLTVDGEIIGIVAAGPGYRGVPSSITNVHHYLLWISEIVGIGNNV